MTPEQKKMKELDAELTKVKAARQRADACMQAAATILKSVESKEDWKPFKEQAQPLRAAKENVVEASNGSLWWQVWTLHAPKMFVQWAKKNNTTDDNLREARNLDNIMTYIVRLEKMTAKIQKQHVIATED